jgi:hypothetical protein
MVAFGDRQTPQANSGYAARQFSRLNRRKCIRLDLTTIQREEAENGLGLCISFPNKNERARDDATGVLPCRLPKE